MKHKNKKIIVSIISIFLLLIITLGITSAVFTYTKIGSTENNITSGTIEFLYTENSGVGAGIQITDAMPVATSVGKNYSSDGYVFDFKITGKNTGTSAIPYEVTLRELSDGSLASAMDVYLTDMNENIDSELLPVTKFNVLSDTTPGEYVEKIIYNGNVPGETNAYEQNFRLRMWMDEATDFSPIIQNGEKVYPYNDKEFRVIVNVYADTERQLGPQS